MLDDQPTANSQRPTANSPAEAYLLTLPRFADQGGTAFKPGLERVQALLAAMDDPHKAYLVVHVAGTNGKGSTASMVAAVGTAAGLRIGLHTSPHLFTLQERMRLDGVPAPAAWLDGAVARYRPAFDRLQPSFFEATVALSLLYFAEQAVDLAVIEVGLGGRLDATNIVDPAAALITTIAKDHEALLGDTLAAIAGEKAGIIKPGRPALTSATQPEVLAVLRAVADAQRAPLHVIQDEVRLTITEAALAHTCIDLYTPLRSYTGLQVALPGRHQVTNAALAVRACELVFEAVQAQPTAVYAGLRNVVPLAGLRGRLEVLQAVPLVVADVAHNADGLRHALAFVAARGDGPPRVILGAMQDKNLDAMAALLRDAGADAFATTPGGARGYSADALAEVLVEAGVAVVGQGTVAEGLAQWVEADGAAPLLITGSHQVVAQIPERVWKSSR